MNQADLIHFLENCVENGSEIALEKGQDWFHTILLPNLTLAEQICPKEQQLLAECWLVVGEVYELTHAIFKALACYEKALLFDKKNPIIHQWISAINEETGNYLAALKHIELAMEYAPDNEELMWDRQSIQDCIVYDKIPSFSITNLINAYFSLLANQQFDQVIARISETPTTDTELLKCLSHAYGSKDDLANYLATWQSIQLLEPELEREAIDWFYMTDCLREKIRLFF